MARKNCTHVSLASQPEFTRCDARTSCVRVSADVVKMSGRHNASRLFTLFPRVPILERCDAFVTNFTTVGFPSLGTSSIESRVAPPILPPHTRSLQESTPARPYSGLMIRALTAKPRNTTPPIMVTVNDRHFIFKEFSKEGGSVFDCVCVWESSPHAAALMIKATVFPNGWKLGDNTAVC
ncbi:hypothetical protein EVAR_30789_1 [Eumeta japonica]|uniref:Uncharacterized protein n=1 Tax=Eumeta variegata TaxID=151549 RepID=A0A4C1V931_EUMVA|nr:hypothetical protein EVAR_30789_1 [Eumeta japonica]